MIDYVSINKASWNRRTDIHVESTFYDIAGFLRGKNTLQQLERTELGCVAGKSLLHLQCHFGLDTLSWARLGADVVGVDLSCKAIEKARVINEQAGLNGQFICADLYEFGENNQTQFDVVFTSYGALCWLPDIERWANIVTKSLKPGGTFYIAEFHPVYDVVTGYSYFHHLQPDVEEEGTYTENDAGDTSTVVTWAHPLSDVLNALIKAGIKILMVNEFPYSPFNCFEGLVEREPNQFYFSHQEHDIPLIYSIKGVKAD